MAQFEKGKPRLEGAGRKKGSPNKITSSVKDMILQALSEAGGVEYLKEQAVKNPTAFMTLLGKILPMQIAGEDQGPIQISWADHISPEVAAIIKDAAGGQERT